MAISKSSAIIGSFALLFPAVVLGASLRTAQSEMGASYRQSCGHDTPPTALMMANSPDVSFDCSFKKFIDRLHKEEKSKDEVIGRVWRRLTNVPPFKEPSKNTLFTAITMRQPQALELDVPPVVDRMEIFRFTKPISDRDAVEQIANGQAQQSSIFNEVIRLSDDSISENLGRQFRAIKTDLDDRLTRGAPYENRQVVLESGDVMYISKVVRPFFGVRNSS